MLLLSRKSRGFTLIELALVMVIAAILGAIATTLFRGEGINVSARAELLASDIRYVQFVAMTLNTSYRINFSANQYSFSSADGLTPLVHLSYGSSVVSLPSSMILSWSVNLNNNYILFDRNGIPYTDNSGTALSPDPATITITGASKTVSIDVAPETGNVST